MYTYTKIKNFSHFNSLSLAHLLEDCLYERIVQQLDEDQYLITSNDVIFSLIYLCYVVTIKCGVYKANLQMF
jgi:hypothetical protein